MSPVIYYLLYLLRWPVRFRQHDVWARFKKRSSSGTLLNISLKAVSATSNLLCWLWTPGCLSLSSYTPGCKWLFHAGCKKHPSWCYMCSDAGAVMAPTGNVFTSIFSPLIGLIWQLCIEFKERKALKQPPLPTSPPLHLKVNGSITEESWRTSKQPHRVHSKMPWHELCRINRPSNCECTFRHGACTHSHTGVFQ